MVVTQCYFATIPYQDLPCLSQIGPFFPVPRKINRLLPWSIKERIQNVVERDYAKSFTQAHYRYNKEITAKVVPGMLSFQRCGKGSEQRLPQEPNKVNIAFCSHITEK